MSWYPAFCHCAMVYWWDREEMKMEQRCLQAFPFYPVFCCKHTPSLLWLQHYFLSLNLSTGIQHKSWQQLVQRQSNLLKIFNMFQSVPRQKWSIYKSLTFWMWLGLTVFSCYCMLLHVPHVCSNFSIHTQVRHFPCLNFTQLLSVLLWNRR